MWDNKICEVSPPGVNGVNSLWENSYFVACCAHFHNPFATHRCGGGHGFESRWSSDIFQASSFQLLKLNNLLRWSLFTFIYNRSTIWISYIFHIISLHGKIWPQQIELAPNVWPHNSVGRLSHRYRGGHGFEFVEALIFFRLLPSNSLNWTIYSDDHFSDFKVFDPSRLMLTKGPQGLQPMIIQISILADHKI